MLNHRFARRQPLILYASHPHFEQTNVLQGSIGEGTGGVTEVLKRRVVMPLAGPIAETDHVLGHELVHAFQFDMTSGGGATSSSNLPNAMRMPLWFIEGMAEYLSVGPVDPHTAMWMRDAPRARAPPPHSATPLFQYRVRKALWATRRALGPRVVSAALGRRPDSRPERIMESSGSEQRSVQAVAPGLREAYRRCTEQRDPASLPVVLWRPTPVS